MNNTSPQAVILLYRLEIEGRILMISTEIEGIFSLVTFPLMPSTSGPCMWLAGVRCLVVRGESWMRPLRAIRSILCLPGLIMVCCRYLSSVADLTSRRLKKLFMYFYCMYEENLLERCGGRRHHWRCCVDHYCATAWCVIGEVVVIQPPFGLSEVDAMAWTNVDDGCVAAWAIIIICYT